MNSNCLKIYISKIDNIFGKKKCLPSIESPWRVHTWGGVMGFKPPPIGRIYTHPFYCTPKATLLIMFLEIIHNPPPSLKILLSTPLIEGRGNLSYMLLLLLRDCVVFVYSSRDDIAYVYILQLLTVLLPLLLLPTTIIIIKT